MKRPLLIDAQQMAVNHPTTFYAPSQEDLAGIRPGFFVKVAPNIKEVERFWVEVLATSDSGIVGCVANDPIFTALHRLMCGDLIEFEPRHIYQILHPEATL